MMNFIGALPGAVSQGLVWGIMAIGVYITYKILDIADLTVDGSFCTGGAMFVVLFGAMPAEVKLNPWLSAGYMALCLLAAVGVGMLAGLATGLLHTVCGIPAILAGILTQLGLWSVNLAIMGMTSNVAINLLDKTNMERLLVCSRFLRNYPVYRHPIFVVGLFTVVLIAVLYWFFGTELGASLRATGTNQHMARAQGINTQFNKVLGLVISNGLVALSGALLSQYQGFADASMGKGAIVIGLAAVIIGEVLFSRIFQNFALKLLSVSLGGVVYYVVIQAVVSFSNINANYLKLISAAIVAVFLTVPYWKDRYFSKKTVVKKGGAIHA